MIFYLSDTLASKRNGGVSLAGVTFLQLLRIHYDQVNVLTYNKLSGDVVKLSEFGGYKTNSLGAVQCISKDYTTRFTIKSILRSILVHLENISKKKSVYLSDYYSPDEENILFVNSWSSLFKSGRIHEYSGYKKVCIVHGNPESFVWQNDGEPSDVAVMNAAAYLEGFDALIYVSSIGRKRWQKIISNHHKSYYLPNSIDEEKVKQLLSIPINDLREQLGFDESSINIVVVGSVQVRKGQDILINFARSLIGLGHNNFHIHVVGVVSEKWGGNNIVNMIKSSDVSDHFTLYGHHSDAMKFVAAADICVFPSRAEAFPLTVAEYMALEKPIVSTNISGVPELITHGVNGYLCESEDAASMANYVDRIIKSPNTAKQLAFSARKTYENEFSIYRQAKRAIDIFEKIDSLSG
jgi:glycosyltransferase involved in cell wall biosynthesis